LAAFVYCDHTNQEEQTPTHLIGALLAQLTNGLPSDDSIMTELSKRQEQSRSLDHTSGVGYIRRIAKSNPDMTIRLGVDGLDELRKDHCSSFLRDLANLSDLPNIRFLFFGRESSGIRNIITRSFSQINTLVACLQITEYLTLADRKLFLRVKLNADGEKFDEELHTLILEKLAAPNSTYVLI
jgi:hypothetical protein